MRKMHTHKVPSKHTKCFSLSALCVMESDQCLVKNVPVNGAKKVGVKIYSFHCSIYDVSKCSLFLCSRHKICCWIAAGN